MVLSSLTYIVFTARTGSFRGPLNSAAQLFIEKSLLPFLVLPRLALSCFVCLVLATHGMESKILVWRNELSQIGFPLCSILLPRKGHSYLDSKNKPSFQIKIGKMELLGNVNFLSISLSVSLLHFLEFRRGKYRGYMSPCIYMEVQI